MTKDDVLTSILRAEGWPEVTDRPSDRGGLTKGGVTFSNFNAWRVSRGERPLSSVEFVGITELDARAFFADQFFRPFEFVQYEPLFIALADWAVNSGPDDPARALQRQLKSVGLYGGAVDGVPGPKTRAAWVVAQSLEKTRDLMLSGVVKARMEFYFDQAFDEDVKQFLRTHPTSQLANLRGWALRALSFA